MLEPLKAFQLFLDFFDSGLFLALRILSVVLSLALLAGTIILIQKGGALEGHIKHLWISWNASPLPKRRMAKRWLSIKKAMKGDDPKGWRAAIIDADSMLDEIIERLEYKGDTLEERLKNITAYQFASIEDARSAHEISNFLKEDPSYSLIRGVAEKTIGIYGNIFSETGIIP
ncbi:MAG: hypothetical protein WAP23_03780 [Candidatus Spechtbacterales bacterium]